MKTSIGEKMCIGEAKEIMEYCTGSNWGNTAELPMGVKVGLRKRAKERYEEALEILGDG